MASNRLFLKNIKNLIVVSIFSTILHTDFYAQTNRGCIKDSTEYQKIHVLMDTSEYIDLPLGWFSDNFLHYQKIKEMKGSTDCFCSLLFYSLAFDYLLNNGLDLNYDYFTDPPYHYSMSVMDQDIKDYLKNKEVEDNRRIKPKNMALTDFMALNSSYKIDVIDNYGKDKVRSLEEDVDNIIRYGVYTRPETLRNILLFKYPDKTKENFSARLNEEIKNGGN